MDTQGFQLLPDNALRHLSAEVFMQQTHTPILLEKVWKHTLATNQGISEQ
jgi:hypothetical protein